MCVRLAVVAVHAVVNREQGTSSVCSEHKVVYAMSVVHRCTGLLVVVVGGGWEKAVLRPCDVRASTHTRA